MIAKGVCRLHSRLSNRSIISPIHSNRIFNKMDSSYCVQEASKADADQLVEIGNQAFMADTFFKKPEFHLRFTFQRVVDMINAENSCFLVAKNDATSEILGSIYVHWDFHKNENDCVFKVSYTYFLCQVL